MSRVLVVGGGLAGITAALDCADAGRQVTLVEAKPRLGGLTYSFRRGELDVDNGQHVFLRCCTAYRALLDRLGVSHQVHLQPRLDIPIRSTWDTRPVALRRGRLPAPLHLSGSLLGYRVLSPAQRLRFVRAALAMRGVDRDDPAVDRRAFGEWLREHGQDRRTVQALWDLVGTATLNARADDASLALAAMVFQVGLLTEADAADIGWALVPLQRLHGDAALGCLTTAGVEVVTGAKVVALERVTDGWRVRTSTQEFAASDVIVAVPPPAAETLLPAGAVPLASGWSARLGSSPIVNVHIVLDRPALSAPFVAFAGSPVQWVFDRTAASGLDRTAAPGLDRTAAPGLDRTAAPGLDRAAASGRAGGQYLALSISAADAYIDRPVAELRQEFLPELSRLLPAVADAEVLDFFVSRERDATFRPAPGSRAYRLPAVTAFPDLALAGAWTDTGWPATMEGAVRSGHTAARTVLGESARERVLA